MPDDGFGHAGPLGRLRAAPDLVEQGGGGADVVGVVAVRNREGNSAAAMTYKSTGVLSDQSESLMLRWRFDDAHWPSTDGTA